MAALGSQSIASSYEQLLHVDADGGGNSTTHVSVKDGDNGTTFGFTIASDALMMSSTNRLEFGDTGTYIHQSADGVLDLVSDTEIEINATTIDMNGAADLSGNLTVGGDIDLEGDIDVNGTANLDNTDIDGTFTQDAGAVVFNEAGADYDFRVEASGEANALFVQGSDGNVGIGTATPTGFAPTVEIQGTQPAFQIVDGDTAVDFLTILVDSEPRVQLAFDDSSEFRIGTASNKGMSGYSAKMVIDNSGDVTFTGDLIMADGKGIDFAADASPAAGMTAEILDDYEEGTWTGVITDGTNPMTMSYTTGYYTKVGNLVHVSGLFSTSSLGSASGDIRMTGLPFTAANNTAAYSGGGAYGHNYDIDPIYPVSYYGKINDTYIYLRVWDVTTGTSAMQASEWTANGQIILGFSYRAA
jgi:hypothetical protein